jgi:hypothetical protein
MKSAAAVKSACNAAAVERWTGANEMVVIDERATVRDELVVVEEH